MQDTQVGIWGWSIADAVWYKVGANAIGELLIDTDALETLLVSLIPADLADITFKVEEQGTPQQNCYGWSGAAWQKLLVEDATNFNLRVALYSGSTILYSKTYAAAGWAIGTPTILHVAAIQCLGDGATSTIPARAARYVSDTDAGTFIPPAGLIGYSGTYWQRLRTYGTGILKVGRAEIGATVKRMTATGQVVVGAKKLMWLGVNPSAANAVLDVTDAIAGGAAVLWDGFFSARQIHHMVFDPPIEFAAGIYIETFTSLTSAIFCYV